MLRHSKTHHLCRVCGGRWWEGRQKSLFWFPKSNLSPQDRSYWRPLSATGRENKGLFHLERKKKNSTQPHNSFCGVQRSRKWKLSCLGPPLLTCAHLRTGLTVGSPGFPNGAAAHLLAQVGGQGVLAAPWLRHHPEALTLLSRRLRIWGGRQRVCIWYRRIQQGDKNEPDTHPRTHSSPTPTQPGRNIWNCRVCSNTVRSGTLPGWSTHWCLRGGGKVKGCFRLQYFTSSLWSSLVAVL